MYGLMNPHAEIAADLIAFQPAMTPFRKVSERVHSRYKSYTEVLKQPLTQVKQFQHRT